MTTFLAGLVPLALIHAASAGTPRFIHVIVGEESGAGSVIM
ncbi:hypothetical protein [Arthrobacter cryoconiti]|uniref:Uncharacterized protein n=1 Tax=Arthrobacter cryoconiti TaxID=748907 RepID=A0ABV8QW66_9MICC|nr:hypothetical protein [Arthrobacter cryoconiti]